MKAVTNPYRGLLPFEEANAALFRGRTHEIQAVCDQLEKHRLLAVMGVSGSGKSSLVKAGVIPAVRAGILPKAGFHVQVATINPGDGPLSSLKKQVSLALGREIDGDKLTQTTYGLIDAVKPMPPGRSLLILVDQFEEIFDYRKSHFAEDAGYEADHFVTLLLRASQQTEIPVFVILTMRSEFLGECAIFRGLPEALNDSHYLVPRMTRKQLQIAIEGPLETIDVGIQPSLTQELLNGCAEETDQLPVLQHVLWRTFEEWQKTMPKQIEQSHYKETGGLATAINADAEQVFSLFPAEQDSLRRIYQRITEKTNTGRTLRRPELLTRLTVLAGLPEDRLDKIVDCFSARGLLVLRQTADGAKLDLPHECLGWKWSRLVRWIEEEARSAKALQFLRDSTEKKQFLDGVVLEEAIDFRKRGLLEGPWPRRYLSESDLSDLRSWLSECEGRIASQKQDEDNKRLAEEKERREAAVLHERELANKRSASRLKKGFVVLALLGIVLTAAVVYGVTKAIEAHAKEAEALSNGRDAVSNGYALAATEVAADDPELGLTLARYALQEQRKGTPMIRDAFGTAVDFLRAKLVLPASDSNAWIPAVDYSSDGRWIAAGSTSGTVDIFDATSGKRAVRSIASRGGKGVNSVAFGPSGSDTLLAAAGDNLDIALYKLGNDGILKNPDQPFLLKNGHRDEVWSVAFSRDGTRVATGSKDQTAVLWDVSTGMPLHTFKQHKAGVAEVTLSPKGEYLATASLDQTAILWDVNSGNPKCPPFGHTNYVYGVSFNPSSTKLATGGWDGDVKIWDVSTCKEVGEPIHANVGQIWGVAYSPDGSRLAVTGRSGTGVVLDTVSNLEILRFSGAGGLTHAAFDRTGKLLATGTISNFARVWDVDVLTLDRKDSQEGNFIQTKFSYNGNVVATAEGDVVATAKGDVAATAKGKDQKYLFRLWDSATRALVKSAQPSSEIRSIAFSQDGNLTATAERNGIVEVWDMEGKRVGEPLTSDEDSGQDNPMHDVAFDSAGKNIAGAWEKRSIFIWSLSDRTSRLKIPIEDADGVRAVAWRPPDDQVLAVGAESVKVRLYSAQGHMQQELKPDHGSQVNTLSFSKDGNRLASGWADGTVISWKLNSTPVAEGMSVITGRKPVRAIRYSHDGKRFATAGEDREIKIWDADTGTRLRTLHGHTSTVLAIAWDADDASITSIGADRRVLHQRIDLDLVNLSGSPVVRPMTTTECQYYVLNYSLKTCTPPVAVH